MTYVILLLTALLVAFVIHVAVRYSDANRPAGMPSSRWLRAVARGVAADWFRGCWDTLRNLRAKVSGQSPAPQVIRPPVAVSPPPAAPPPVPVAPVSPAPPLAPVPVPADGAMVALSPAFAAAVAEIGGHEPEDDADLIGFMRHAAAFQAAQADAWRALLDRCLHEVGLDPASVQGVAEYADVMGDTAHDATGMAAQFATVYAQVRDWLADGGVLPHDGRWLTGEGA